LKAFFCPPDNSLKRIGARMMIEKSIKDLSGPESSIHRKCALAANVLHWRSTGALLLVMPGGNAESKNDYDFTKFANEKESGPEPQLPCC